MKVDAPGVTGVATAGGVDKKDLEVECLSMTSSDMEYNEVYVF